MEKFGRFVLNHNKENLRTGELCEKSVQSRARVTARKMTFFTWSRRMRGNFALNFWHNVSAQCSRCVTWPTNDHCSPLEFSVAQWLERPTSVRQVVGLTPICELRIFFWIHSLHTSFQYYYLMFQLPFTTRLIMSFGRSCQYLKFSEVCLTGYVIFMVYALIASHRPYISTNKRTRIFSVMGLLNVRSNFLSVLRFLRFTSDSVLGKDDSNLSFFSHRRRFFKIACSHSTLLDTNKGDSYYSECIPL